jgi:hypothetical protein
MSSLGRVAPDAFFFLAAGPAACGAAWATLLAEEEDDAPEATLLAAEEGEVPEDTEENEASVVSSSLSSRQITRFTRADELDPQL